MEATEKSAQRPRFAAQWASLLQGLPHDQLVHRIVTLTEAWDTEAQTHGGAERARELEKARIRALVNEILSNSPQFETAFAELTRRL